MTKPENEVEILLQVTRLARRIARHVVAPDDVDDIAQDVALECLIKLRNGYWVPDAAAATRLVRSIVRRRAVDYRRSTLRRAKRDAEHERTRSDSVHAWMAPDLAQESGDLNELHTRAIAALPDACRRAYLLVRHEQLSYKEAATRLGLTRDAVQSHVVRAQRRLAAALRTHGVQLPRRARNGAALVRRVSALTV